MDNKDKSRLLDALLDTLTETHTIVDNDVEIKCNECDGWQYVTVEHETLVTTKLIRVMKTLGYISMEAMLIDAFNLNENSHV